MPTVTLAAIMSRIYSRLDNNQALYDSASVLNEINDGIAVINLMTGAIQTTVQVATQGATLSSIGQLIYPTPTGMIYPVAVRYEGRELTPISLRALAGQSRSWATEVCSPGKPCKYWAPLGISQFVLNPIDSLGGRSLTITGVAEPTPLVLPNDVIPLPNDYVDMLEELVAGVLPVREGGQVFTAAVKNLFGSFVRKVKLKSAYTNLVWPAYFDKIVGRLPMVPSTARIEQ